MQKKISEEQIKLIDGHLAGLRYIFDTLEELPQASVNPGQGFEFPGFIVNLTKLNETFHINNVSGSFSHFFGDVENIDFEFFDQFMGKNDFIILEKELNRALTKNLKLRGDFRFVNEKKREIFWFEIIFYPDKKENKIVLIFIENTERKEYEEQERILTELDKSSSLKSLVSCIAHEINNPNHNIMQNISLLENGWQDILTKLDEYYEEHGDFNIKNVQYSNVRDYLATLLEKILNSSRQIKGIIDDLRTFSQNTQNMLFDQVNLNILVQKTIELLRHQINKSTTNFVAMYASDMAPVLGNYKQLQQVIINLLHNSFQALQSTDDEIKIFTFFNPIENIVGVGVSDKGCGMDQEDVNNIFNHFYSLKSGKNGSGLGLPISKEIIEMHKGTISIDSKVGKGTSVIIKLPAKVGRK